MKNLLRILSKTELRKDSNTQKVFNRVIKNAFYRTSSKDEAETLVILAYKYQLPCLDQLLKNTDLIPEIPF